MSYISIEIDNKSKKPINRSNVYIDFQKKKYKKIGSWDFIPNNFTREVCIEAMVTAP